MPENAALAGSIVRFFANGLKTACKPNSITELRKQIHLQANLPHEKKVNTLLAGLGSVRIGKNCKLGLKNKM